MREVIIFGQVRHCRRAAEGFHAGIAIEDAFYSAKFSITHVHQNKLALYMAGKDLTTREALEIGEHLRTCDRCNSTAKQDASTSKQS